MAPKKRHRRARAPSADPPDAACTSSLAHAVHTWLPFSVSRLAVALGDEAADDTYRRYCAAMLGLTLSTAFSGVGSPEAALVNIAEFFVGFIGMHALSDFSLKCLYGIEIDGACRSELLCSPSLA